MKNQTTLYLSLDTQMLLEGICVELRSKLKSRKVNNSILVETAIQFVGKQLQQNIYKEVFIDLLKENLERRNKE